MGFDLLLLLLDNISRPIFCSHCANYNILWCCQAIPFMGNGLFCSCITLGLFSQIPWSCHHNQDLKVDLVSQRSDILYSPIRHIQCTCHCLVTRSSIANNDIVQWSASTTVQVFLQLRSDSLTTAMRHRFKICITKREYKSVGAWGQLFDLQTCLCQQNAPSLFRAHIHHLT